MKRFHTVAFSVSFIYVFCEFPLERKPRSSQYYGVARHILRVRYCFLVRQQEVKWAMEKIEKYSGIRFVEYNASVPVIHGLSHNNRLSFVDYGG